MVLLLDFSVRKCHFRNAKFYTILGKIACQIIVSRIVFSEKCRFMLFFECIPTFDDGLLSGKKVTMFYDVLKPKTMLTLLDNDRCWDIMTVSFEP